MSNMFHFSGKPLRFFFLFLFFLQFALYGDISIHVNHHNFVLEDLLTKTAS
jgi:hypothetical protein